MSKQIEALKLALEALETEHSAVYGTSQTARAITAIREALAEQPAQPSKPLTDEQIDRAIAELGLDYFADAANNRAVLRELCRKAAHGIKGDA